MRAGGGKDEMRKVEIGKLRSGSAKTFITTKGAKRREGGGEKDETLESGKSGN